MTVQTPPRSSSALLYHGDGLRCRCLTRVTKLPYLEAGNPKRIEAVRFTFECRQFGETT